MTQSEFRDELLAQLQDKDAPLMIVRNRGERNEYELVIQDVRFEDEKIIIEVA